MRKLVLLLLLSSACRPKPQLVHSFYFWKMEQGSDSAVQESMKDLEVQHFYIHLFDVDWDKIRQKAIPRSITHTTGFNSIKNISYTPVVFITNTVFERSTPQQSDTLALLVYREVINIRNARLPNHDFDELQIDCDWTASTRENYFRFLTSLKKQLHSKQLSVTIRLYPYKYAAKMGVPPVDRGVLMCYNLGNIQDPHTRNSIFDKKELGRYLGNKTYPIPLDIALPIFGWYVWSRNDHYKSIIYESPSLVNGHGFSVIGGNNYRVMADTVMQGQYLRSGDILRREYPEEGELISAARDLLRRHEVHERIIFYHWDTHLIKKYEQVIKQIYGLH